MYVCFLTWRRPGGSGECILVASLILPEVDFLCQTLHISTVDTFLCKVYCLSNTAASVDKDIAREDSLALRVGYTQVADEPEDIASAWLQDGARSFARGLGKGDSAVAHLFSPCPVLHNRYEAFPDSKSRSAKYHNLKNTTALETQTVCRDGT